MEASAVLKLIRPHNGIFAGTGVLIGGIIGLGGIPSFRIIFAFLAVALVSGAGNAVNDYSDRDLDAVNNPDRPIPAGEISPSGALQTSGVLYALGMASAALTGKIACLLLAALNSGLLALYAADLKRRGLTGNLAIGYLVGSTFLFGALAVGGFMVVGILAAMAALSTTGRELIKDVEDISGDKKSGSKSFPIEYGKKRAAALAIFLTLVAIGLAPLPYFLGIFHRLYLAVLAGSIVAFAAGMGIIGRRQGKEDAGRASTAYKVGMGLGLIAFMVGAIA